MADTGRDGPRDEANRQRRLGDAAKLVPFLAAILMAVPTLWTAGSPTSVALVYIFAIWGGMILTIAFLSRALSRFLARGDGRPAPRGDRR